MTQGNLNDTKRHRVKPGDIFAIPLPTETFAVGIALHISKYFKNGMLAGYFDRCFLSIDAINISELEPEFAFTPNYTSKRIVALGEWPIIGYSEALLARATVPILVSVTTLFYKDEVVGQLDSIEETKDYERLAGQGKEFVEIKLRRYFQLTGCI
ncbi:protein of unknown function [Candidatus Promineifilum breve]|uniref:Uncharacterized protein n=1 Tax=Candidatus Promineifilum breve TaxID=1806508 RepID=A0A170PIL8_9CHLR|nr:Imm26 family immunity protein [Candidatus Promineifilum breve]CUS04923.2 protein of unknown function [Candidatus Promineifilum breve]